MSDVKTKGIRQKRLDLGKLIRKKYSTMLFKELEELIALYEKEIESLGGDINMVRKDNYRIKMRYIYQEMSDRCSDVEDATDYKLKKMHEKTFSCGS